MRMAASFQEVWGRLSPNNLNSAHIHLKGGKIFILCQSQAHGVFYHLDIFYLSSLI